MFRFEYPYLGFLILIPLIVIFFLKNNISYVKESILYPNLTLLESAFDIKTKNNFLFQYLLFFLLWLFLILSLMRPQVTTKIVNISNKGNNIMIAADLSGSMRALDFSTQKKYITRLDFLKKTTSDFISKREGDKIGLVLFGDNAYLHIPLTSDINSVKEMLNNTVIGMAGDSTAIGDAIGLSIKKMQNIDSKSSTIILLTDGENTSGKLNPIAAANIAKKFGIKIYTIGIGKTGRTSIADKYGNIFPVQVKLDEELLKNISDITNAKYFNATSYDLMKDIYNEINKLEKIDNDKKEFLVKKELYRIPLAISMFILILIYLIKRKL